jgi:lysophospholipase
MAHFTSSIKSEDGLNLNLQWWESDQSPKAVIQIVHGISEHIGRYAYIASVLNRSGYHVVGHDHRGHGRSDGEKVFVKDFQEYTHDVHLIMHHVRTRYENLPCFLFGHSMGGLIAVKYLQDFLPDVTGVILTGPALKISTEFSPVLQKIVSFLGRVSPHMKTQKLDLSKISRDPKVIKLSNADTLMYRDGIKAGFARAMLTASKAVRSKLKKFDYPFLVMQGTADKLVNPAGAALMYRESISVDKTIKVYPGLYHEIFNEPEKEQVFQDIVEWLDKRAG